MTFFFFFLRGLSRGLHGSDVTPGPAMPRTMAHALCADRGAEPEPAKPANEPKPLGGVFFFCFFWGLGLLKRSCLIYIYIYMYILVPLLVLNGLYH